MPTSCAALATTRSNFFPFPRNFPHIFVEILRKLNQKGGLRMEPYWDLFYDTGDPLAWLLHRSQPLPAEQAPTPETDCTAKEATPWQPPPIS